MNKHDGWEQRVRGGLMVFDVDSSPTTVRMGATARRLLVLGAALALATSCGTRVVRDSASSGNLTGSQATAPPDTSFSTAPLEGSALPSSAETQQDRSTAAQPGSPGTRPAGDSTRPVAGSGAQGAVPSPSQNRTGRTEPSSSAVPAKTPEGAPSPQVPGGPGGKNQTVGGQRSKLVVAGVGTWSGVIGRQTVDIARAVRVWVRWINDRGGVAGHPVEYIQADDGGDPARYRSQLQEMVERKGAIAILGNAAPLSRSAQATAYLESKRVPVVGGILSEDEFATSWAHFPQGTTPASIFPATLSTIAKHSDKRRYGYLTCTEGMKICEDADHYWSSHAPDFGLQLVWHGKVPLSQPDFTAECLSARNAGTEVISGIVDVSTMRRFAASCARQNYHPQFSLLSISVEPQLTTDPNFEGTLGTVSSFPFTLRNTPATAEFAAAIQQYLPGVAPNPNMSLGWAAGKLFEKAGVNFGDTVTSEDILNGLWSLQNETLGGLTVPLTYHREKPTGEITCWFTMSLQKGAWSELNQAKPSCL